MTKSKPNDIDRAIGDKLYRVRKSRKLSQNDLGQLVGITFQQIQKYGKTRNRISASRLYDLSEALLVSPSYFFEDLPVSENHSIHLALQISRLDEETQRFIGHLINFSAQKKKAYKQG